MKKIAIILLVCFTTLFIFGNGKEYLLKNFYGQDVTVIATDNCDVSCLEDGSNETPDQFFLKKWLYVTIGNIDLSIPSDTTVDIEWYGDDYRIISCYAANDSIRINDQNIPLDKTEPIRFYDNGIIEYMTVGKQCRYKMRAGEHDEYNIVCEKGTILYFYKSGKLFFFEEKSTHQDQKLRGKKLSFYCSKNALFDEEGYLLSGTFSNKTDQIDIPIGDNTIPIKCNPIIESYRADFLLYNSGALFICFLANDTDLKVGEMKYPFKQDQPLLLFKSGKIAAGILNDDINISLPCGNISFCKGEMITFFEDGSIKSGVPVSDIDLTSDISVKLPFKKGSNILLNKQGYPRYGTIASKCKVKRLEDGMCYYESYSNGDEIIIDGNSIIIVNNKLNSYPLYMALSSLYITIYVNTLNLIECLTSENSFITFDKDMIINFNTVTTEK